MPVVNSSVQTLPPAQNHKADFIGTLAKLGVGIGTSVATGNPLPAIGAVAGTIAGSQGATPSVMQSGTTGGGAGGGGTNTSWQGPLQPGQTAPGVNGPAAPVPVTQQPDQSGTQDQQKQANNSGPRGDPSQSPGGTLGSNMGHLVMGALLANPSLLSSLLPSSGFGSGSAPPAAGGLDGIGDTGGALG
jgi:hypothetical protein